MEHFGTIAFGRSSQEHQRRRGSYASYRSMLDGPAPAGLGTFETEFLTARDSFYLSSVGEDGWPYVQHRGGPAGFLKVIDATHIAWADRAGNRQYITAGNVDQDDRIAIIAVDYPNRTRIKLLGHARFDPSPDPALLEQLGIDGRLEGLVTVEVTAVDWNCPKFITPRFTADEIRAATTPLADRISVLETELAALRAAGSATAAR